VITVILVALYHFSHHIISFMDASINMSYLVYVTSNHCWCVVGASALVQGRRQVFRARASRASGRRPRGDGV